MWHTPAAPAATAGAHSGIGSAADVLANCGITDLDALTALRWLIAAEGVAVV